MPSGSSSKSKPKPADVASETKRKFIPLIREEYAGRYKINSYLYHQPLAQLDFHNRLTDYVSPNFYVYPGDPVDGAVNWARDAGAEVPFICSANDGRPGGDWETGAAGYEERLCRRSTLSANLASPAPAPQADPHYPIPMYGGILSPQVVVFRGPHDRYEKLPPDQWSSLPVVSVPPARWPKLTQSGTKYSFSSEREMVKDKLRGALRICAASGFESVVIGDFGLGNGYRNPPQELAELWREVLLYDPDLRGRIRHVAFVFEDPSQSTAQLILDDLAKKSKGSSHGSSSKSKSSKSSKSATSSSCGGDCPTDFAIFAHVFSNDEVQRVLSQPDYRCGLNNILA
ncbi:hypothetical protein B0T18DRAFT_117029 [Schizothecium vesticola]|uniref:Microbial-type PARG catalytic domain-containing protein n=1 Tax=Schizothecium vesticola TaxID=314040 RepID=A0AA40F2B9_9PEZI|nr:hypothetical protein B0T18DRAFT_117029 [Schizothecium vesticola]